MFKRNEGNLDRVLRVVVGVALIGVGLIAVGGVGGTIMAVVGLVPLVTGAAGTCPVYSVVGINTCGLVDDDRDRVGPAA